MVFIHDTSWTSLSQLEKFPKLSDIYFVSFSLYESAEIGHCFE